MIKGKEVIEYITNRYPQLNLDICEGQSKSEEYKNIVMKGKLSQKTQCSFPIHDGTSLYQVETIVGNVEVLYFPIRDDFVRFVQIIAYRCEPVRIPDSMGATTIRNINNWRKIDGHKMAYLLSGNTDWQTEFKRFTANPENYRDTIIVLSEGEYSGLTYQNTPYEQHEWVDISREIRKFHELTHFISGRLYADNCNVLRDEVIADCIGLLAATGGYETQIAKKVLGIEGGSYRKGGRLENYAKSQNELQQWAKSANKMIDELEVLIQATKRLEPFEFLERLEIKRVLINDC
jgi:hypothetical protein